MLKMKNLQGNEILPNILMNQYIEDERLYIMLNEENSIPILTNLLQFLYERINRNLSGKRNFTVDNILNDKCSLDLKRKALYFALCIQADHTEFKKCLYLFNDKLSIVYSHGEWNVNNDLSELLWLAAVIIDVSLKLKENICIHVDKLQLKIFLLKICDLKLSKDISIDRCSLFFQYFDIILLDESNFFDETLQYFITQENLDFLCLMCDKKLSDLITSNFFQKDDLWNFLKIHVISDNNVKKKQAQYILWRTIQYLKKNERFIPEALKMSSFTDWDLFFLLLEMSKEKQLHLIQPTLKLLPSMTKLHISWQICLYRELLHHSRVIEHIFKLRFTCDEIHQDLLYHVLEALNKFEYSNSSKELFKKLEVFCTELPENCQCIFFEKYLNVEWNPAAGWCVLTSASPILHTIPEHYIIQMMKCLEKLPHMYIKQGCIIFFLRKLFIYSDEIFKNLLLIGNFLVSSGQKHYKDIFHRIIDEKKVELEMGNKHLREMVVKSVREHNAEHLIVCMELVKELKMEIDYKLEMPHSILNDIIILYFPNLLKPFNVATYILQRFQNLHDNDYRYLLKFLELSFDNDLANISKNECLDIWNSSLKDKNKKLIAMYLICTFAEVDKFSVDTRLTQQVENEFKLPTYYDVWFKKFRKSFNRQILDAQQLGSLIEKFQELLDIDDDNVLKIIVDNIELVTQYFKFENSESFNILDTCLRKLCILPNNLMRTYSIVFFQSIFELNLFSQPLFAEYWEKWYKEFFERYFMECESLMKVMLEGCRKIILLEAAYASILTPLILSAVTRGIIIQKSQRVEYGICQEIQDCVGATFIPNPNMMAIESKMLSIECLCLLAKNKSLNNLPSADDLIEMLLNIYAQSFKKRYFPDSKIHLEKLRIVQAMLMIVNYIDKSKEKLIQFILNSFCEESHQPSVKQLLQWLLIILVSKSACYFNLMIQKVDTAGLSHPSSVVALIPVLYHLLSSLENGEHWYQLTDALLPWTMGANFKLRVYAQITLRYIIRKAKEKQLYAFIQKYSFLETSISKVIDATGNAITETLKNDLTFIETFDPYLHYTVENIFVALPRMLGVPPSEWQNVLNHDFSEKIGVEIESVNKLPNILCNENTCGTEVMNEPTGINVQKKIIPWKQDVEEKIENKSLSSLICVASLVEKSSNLGGLSRTCEIFNVKQLVLHNIKIKDDKEFKNLSMSSENWVDFMEVKKDDLSNFMIELKKEDYSIVGLEQTSESVKLNNFKFEKKTVILLGNEREGIPAPLLPLLDTCVEIPQFGQTRSLNVHVAGATFIWEYVKQHLL